jgi:hypothetical protein
MGPHFFFGLTWAELASIITIVGVLIGFFTYLMHVSVTKPMEWSNKALQKSIDQLTEQVKGIGSNADIVHKEHDGRLDQHDVHLMKHDEEIKTLFKRTGNRGH